MLYQQGRYDCRTKNEWESLVENITEHSAGLVDAETEIELPWSIDAGRVIVSTRAVRHTSVLDDESRRHVRPGMSIWLVVEVRHP